MLAERTSTSILATPKRRPFWLPQGLGVVLEVLHYTAPGQLGIKEVVAHGDAIDKTPERWADSINAAMRLFEENGVIYTKVYGKIGDCENLFDGEIWYP
jgi:hypothetical protein